MKFVVLIFFFLAAHTTYAQSILKGQVMEIRNDILLSGIKVENQSEHINTFTDDHGKFSIKAKKGDLLCFSGLNYLPDTVYLTNLKNLTILLELRQNQLQEVTVKGAQVNPGYFNPYAETGPFGSHTVLYKEGGGLKINLFDSHSHANKKRKNEQRELNGQKEQAIASAFSAANLKKYLPITGPEMDNFIIKYRPDVKTFYNSSFNLGVYLNDSYKEFLKIPEEKRRSVTYFQLNSLGN